MQWIYPIPKANGAEEVNQQVKPQEKFSKK